MPAPYPHGTWKRDFGAGVRANQKEKVGRRSFCTKGNENPDPTNPQGPMEESSVGREKVFQIEKISQNKKTKRKREV